MAFGGKLWNRFKKVVDGLITAAVVIAAGLTILTAGVFIAAIGTGMIISGGLPMALVLGGGLFGGILFRRYAKRNHAGSSIIAKKVFTFPRSGNENSGYAPQNPAPQTRPAGAPAQSPRAPFNQNAAKARFQRAQQNWRGNPGAFPFPRYEDFV